MISQVEATVKRLEKDVDDLRKHVEERISSSPESIVKARSNPDASIKRHCQMNEKVMSEHSVKTMSGRTIEDPPIARFLFGDTRLSAVWLVIRVLIGYSWLSAGLEKLSNPAWTQTGAALQGYWTGAVTVSAAGKTPITFDWYRSFIQGMLDSGSYVWFSKLVVAGEVLVGIALIIGAFVGVAAFIAALMNWNYIMAGSASSNGLLLVGAIVLILAWKTAGYYGLDRFLLPRLGTPWTTHKLPGDSLKPTNPPNTFARE